MSLDKAFPLCFRTIPGPVLLALTLSAPKGLYAQTAEVPPPPPPGAGVTQPAPPPPAPAQAPAENEATRAVVENRERPELVLDSKEGVAS